MQIVPLLLVLGVSSAHAKTIKIHKGNRIFGGKMAEQGEFPYQTSIQTLYSEHICGGCIISDRYILTAAHCLENHISNHRESELKVVTGTTRYEQPGGTYYVEKLINHRHYGKNHNDIGLILLNSSIVFDNVTQPALLPNEPLEEDDEVVLSGWGNTDFDNDLPDDLQKIKLKYVPHDKCLRALDNNPALDISHICTYTKEGEGSCYGDSGSPLVKDGAVYGLVNWGYPCATGQPDAHANVYYFNDFIRSNMNGCQD